MELATFTSIISGGLFAGGALTIAWDRLPAWQKMPPEVFKLDYRRTVLKADVLQPLLLVIAMVSTLIVGLGTEGLARGLAFTALGLYLLIMLASLAVLVPLQRKILQLPAPSEPMQQRWFKGHLGRALLSVASFGVSAAAIALL